MNIKDFAQACVLTAMVVVIEIVAGATGEILAFLTIASPLPIYIISRKSLSFGIASYICVSTILLQINPHKFIIFVFTNGLIGISLGFCDKLKCSVISILISGMMLFVGVTIAFRFLGIHHNQWQINSIIFLFSCVYIAFYRFIAIRAYKKFIQLENRINRGENP